MSSDSGTQRGTASIPWAPGMEANLEADELPAGTPDMDAWAMGDAVAHKLVRQAQSRWSSLSRSVTPAGPVAGGVAGIP